MPFADIDTVWEYQQLIDKARNIKPYKNSGIVPTYPLGNRRYSNRYFAPVLNACGEHIENGIVNGEQPWQDFDLPITANYCGKLGTFYPDNTFEFNPNVAYYGQGEAGVISSMLPGWVESKAQYGGLVFKHRQSRNIVPVFQGLKIRLCDGTPVQDYEIHAKCLDKKLTKKYRNQYDPMFKTGAAMLRAMGVEGTVNELVQMAEGQVSPAYNYNHKELDKAFDPNDPAGAILWLTLRYNIYECRHRLQRAFSNNWGYQRFIQSMGAEVLIHNVRKYFYNEVYNKAIEDGDDVRQTKVYKFGDKIPTVEWGCKIFVDGQEVRRIS